MDRDLPDVRVGISGFSYAAWRGPFYPRDLAHHRELAYASRHVNSIEINGTFYSLQRPASFLRWRYAAPPGFRFALKGPRYITHMKKLRDVDAALANFFASGPLALDDMLGPILWQFPPFWPLDLERFAAFFARLPGSTAEAARLARHHDTRLAGRAWLRVDRDQPLRYAVEVRHPSCFTPAFIRLLRRHRVALVFADTAGVFPYAEDVTADFVYLRLHGAGELYVGGYGERLLAAWADKIRAWRDGGEPPDATRVVRDGAPPAYRGRDVFVYFDNDAKVHAPFDAMTLAAQLGPGLVTRVSDLPLAPTGTDPRPARMGRHAGA